MKTQFSSTFDALKSGIYPHASPVSVMLNFKEMGPTSLENDRDKLVESIFLMKIEKILKTGIMWKFNPTCLALFIEGDTFEFDRNKLLSYLQDYISLYGHEEVDRNNHLYHAEIELEFLLINLVQLEPSIVNSSSETIVQTPMGDLKV